MLGRARPFLREMAVAAEDYQQRQPQLLKMILTRCPVCAAELPPLSAKQCSRCKTRYCGPACQKQHWEAGGHDKLCKLIKRGGGAEQYHADTKYTKVVAVAAEACADDTKGQTCYICTQAVHWKTKEGLVRGCSCRGTAGVAHVSCLAEQAKILYAEAEENNLGVKVKNERFSRWHACSLCEQGYHGVVRGALGWACWKTYVGRLETDWARQMAINMLGNGLSTSSLHEDALSVREAELSMLQRLGAPEQNILVALGNLATTYETQGRLEQALRLRRDVYSGFLKLFGEENIHTILNANNYVLSLVNLQRFEEAKALQRKTLPVTRRVCGENHEVTLKARLVYGETLYRDPSATLDDLREAVETIEDTARTARRVLGGSHPLTEGVEYEVPDARAALAAREGTPPGNARP